MCYGELLSVYDKLIYTNRMTVIHLTFQFTVSQVGTDPTRLIWTRVNSSYSKAYLVVVVSPHAHYANGNRRFLRIESEKPKKDSGTRVQLSPEFVGGLSRLSSSRLFPIGNIHDTRCVFAQSWWSGFDRDYFRPVRIALKHTRVCKMMYASRIKVETTSSMHTHE